MIITRPKRHTHNWCRRPPHQTGSGPMQALSVENCKLLFPNMHSITAFILLVQLLVSMTIVTNVNGSPPVEFLRYTSQPNGSLAPIETIYREATNDTQLADKLLKMVQNRTHTHDNNHASDFRLTKLAWNLMEKQALLYMERRVADMKPFVGRLLSDANVTSDCQLAISGWLDHLAKLDLWASVMWNSWGDFPPAGLFEGSFTDLGSYPGCLSIEPNEIIGEPQYCMLDFQPLVPTRPRFHLILQKVLSVDPLTGYITRGDFESEPNLNSSHSAHEFGTSRFRHRGSSGKSTPSNNQNHYYKRTIETKLVQNNNYNNGSIDNLNTFADQLNSSTLTLRSEAMMEFAEKAHYFYYVKFRLGSCLPSKCSQSDVEKIAQAAGERAILQAGQVNCLKREPVVLNTYQIVAIVILSTLTLIAALGTLVDLLGFKASESGTCCTPTDWLLLFSIWTNGRRLFDIYTNGNHADLEVVHGLRILSMIWVIYGHTILYTEYQAFTHFFDVVETKILNFALLPSLNANFSVDTFFVISGVLTTYVTWEFMRGDPRKFNKIAFAVSRYIRLTPQLVIIILLFFLLPLTGEGPLFKQVTEYQANLCYKGWLTNLLYLQSYSDSEKICIDPSWWLSIEMSFHLISILIISVMVRNPKQGLWLNFGIAGALTLWGAIIHYTNGFAIQYMPSIPQRYEVQSEQTLLFFHRPYPHAPSYFIGTALGYLLATRTIKRLTNLQLVQGWLVCFVGLAVPLWGTYFWNIGAPYTQLQATLYYHLCQILWPIAIAWIIFVCSLGQGGWIHSILAAPVFAPLGRITYMTYLSHALIIFYHSACRNIPVEPSIMSFIYASIANTILSLILGVILTVVFESPILNMQKHLVVFLSRKFDKPQRLPSSSGACKEVDQTLSISLDNRDHQETSLPSDEANGSLLLKNKIQKR